MAFGITGINQTDRGLSGLMDYTKKKKTAPASPLIKQTPPANQSLASAPRGQYLTPQTQPVQRQPVQTQPQPQREQVTTTPTQTAKSPIQEGLTAVANIAKSVYTQPTPANGDAEQFYTAPDAVHADPETYTTGETDPSQQYQSNNSTFVNIPKTSLTQGGPLVPAGLETVPAGGAAEAYANAAKARKYSKRNITEADLQELGLPDTYLGLPHSQGYEDANGNWVVEEDLLGLAKQMHDTINQEKPEQIDVLNSDAYTQLQELNRALASGEMTAQDHEAAVRYLEDIYGYEPGEFQQRQQDMQAQLDLGENAQEGLGEDYINTWNTETQMEMQNMREESDRLMEQLGYDGRYVKGLRMAFSLAREQSDFRSARDAELAAQNMAKREMQYQALENRLNTLREMGQITIGQYTQALREDRVAAIQGFATEITSMFEQNRSNREAYATMSQVAINNIMMQIGVSESLLNQSSTYYESYMAPYIAAMEAEAQINEQKALEAKQAQDTAGLIITGLTLVAKVVLFFATGMPTF